MRPAVRVGLVVLGAAMAVYGAASLTGGWLVRPLIWQATEDLHDTDLMVAEYRNLARSSLVVGVGVVLVAVGAWPRRQRAGA